MKLSTTLRRKAFPLILVYSIASIICYLTIPLMVPMATGDAPPHDVIFRVENVTKDALGFPGLVTADIYIDSPEGSAIVGWRVNIKVDPDVLEPGYDFNGDVYWAVSAIGGYFLYDWATPNNYTVLFEPGDRSVTAGTITGTIEGIVGWLSLEPGTGANGTGKLVTLLFTYKNETAYSPIEITEAYYYTSWNNPDLPMDKRIPDIIFHGHYNEPTYDVAVTAISAPSQATVGDSVPINVTVANLGAPAVLNLTLTYDTAIETRLMSLASATSKTESFTWNTTGLTPGEYVINATAIRPGDVDPNNNFDTATITLLAHDVAVTDIGASSYEVDINTQLIVTISVDVANEGDFPETFNVTVRYDTTDIDTETVTDLPAGNSTTVDFEWTITGVPLNTPYTIEAEAILAGDDNPTNNKMTSDWTIKIVPEFPTPMSLILMLAILAVSAIILMRRTRKHLLTQT